MENLKTKRQTLKGSITRIYTLCVNPNSGTDEITARISALDDLFAQYGAVQDEIDKLTTDPKKQEEEEIYRTAIEDKYFMIKSTYTTRLREEEANNTIVQVAPQDNNITQAIQAMADSQNSIGVLLERLTTDRGFHSSPINTTTNQSQHHEPRLPQIQIPEFDGTYTEWIRFRDLFDALIHSKTTISNVEKLEYLQSRLKGEALSIIKHLKPTNDNYTIAWQLINNKYDKSQQVRRAYLELLFDQPGMRKSSVDETKQLFNNTNESVNALKVLKEPTQHWDTILLFHLERKLDAETHILWCREKKAVANPTFESFLQFLSDRVTELESVQHCTYRQPPKTTMPISRSRNQLGTYAATMQTCIGCNESHFLYQCDRFKELSIEDRYTLVKQHNLCFNCLRPNHVALNCKSSSCKTCNAKHNTLLHFIPRQLDNQPQILLHSSDARQIEKSQKTYTFLPTTMIMVRDKYDQLQPCRAFLDSCAQHTLISENCAQRLQLKKFYDKTLMYRVGPDQGSYTKGKVSLEIVSTPFGKTIITEALCLSTLARDFPSHDIGSQKFEYFRNLKMADPKFNKSAPVDIIIGAEVYNQFVLSDKIFHPSGSPVAIDTIFGWVIMGSVETQVEPTIFAAHVSIDLDEQLQRFWKIEEVNSKTKILSEEEKAAENHFEANFEKLDNGRYMVKLPFKNDIIELGESKTSAQKRLMSMERRFTNNSELKNEYVNFIREYQELNHMELEQSSHKENGYFLPHHAVLKPSSSTTKLRVVFDASCQTTNGSSLNDKLLVGPTIQNDLFTILLKFRKYQIAFSADVEKMYRQVLIHPDDRRFQRILWRESIKEPVKEYCLNTITYGIASAPFLAIRTLHQISLENSKQYPEVSKAIDEQFYVDDFMSCSENVHSAMQLRDNLCTVLSKSGFHLRKWSSNSMEFMQSVNPSDKSTASETVIESSQTVKTLGLLWDTASDSFKFSIDLQPITNVITKRSVLSDIARVFDPIGLLAPIVVSMKIFMQKLWLQGIDWDQQLPEQLFTQWQSLRDNIQLMRELRVPRWMGIQNDSEIELHGFADSSELAYAAVIYLKVVSKDGSIHTSLITSKTRVAPVKQISVPRLELCGAHLLVQLMIKVQQALAIEKCKVFGWSDSSIVLAWISDHPRRWKSFVANRTSYILEHMPASQWQHIPSGKNPADLATRGLSASELLENNLWWHGPDVLMTEGLIKKEFPTVPTEIDMEEKKESVLHLTTKHSEENLFELYSKYNKLVRITALILRFINNCRVGKGNRTTSFLTAYELQQATYQLAKASQLQTYSDEIRILSSGKPLPNNHKLSNLAPFIDKMGVMRVGGRLENAQINYDQKHPVILNKDHKLTGLLVDYYHSKYLHAGHRQTLYLIGLKYWIPHVTCVVKRFVYKCITCMRFRSISYQQQMANLPQNRIQPSAAFINTGVDFAGPIQVRSWKGRGSRLYKSWIAVFVCLATKAIHLELVTELSAAAFTAALRRFVSRRGKPLHMYSDNGTNFVGCNQQLRELYQFLNQTETQGNIQKEMCDQQIQWHFSPPSAPHFGGIWEAGVKSTKYHLKRVLADASLTYEEMSTVLCQVEGCLNSRPLCIKFEGDLDPLTPAHFLIFRPMAAIPDSSAAMNSSYCNRWQHLQKLVHSFWTRWSREYLKQMQQRPKWAQKLENLKVNDIVVVKDENVPPTKWSIARIVETHPGADGLVRVVTVKTAKGCYKRPIVKLCPLFLDI